MGLPREVLEGIERCLHERAGLDLPRWIVEARARERIGALGLPAADYLAHVRSRGGAGELSALVEAVRVGETSFFRHRPHVDALLDVVIPAWRERRRASPRVWSAGCATGEEAYTLALVLARALPRPAYSPSILGTDVSEDALAIARTGTYPAAAAATVPEPFRDGMIVQGGAAQIRPDVRSLVTFEAHNLASAVAPRGFDLVWCRNVLIYFGPEARRRALERLVGALAPHGFLFLGYSETLRDVPGLAAVPHGDQVLWQKAPSSHGVAATRPAGRGRAATPERENAQNVFDKPSAPPPASAAPRAAPARPRATIRVTGGAPAELAAHLESALGAPGLRRLTLDLDAADFLDDETAPVLRRAAAAAASAGIELRLHATRPGTKRWLRRNGLGGGGE